jgi:hypothetical protein
MLAKLTSMSVARRQARIYRPVKEQHRPVVARVTVQPGVSSRAPEVQRSIKVQVSRDIRRMMVTLPLLGRDISSSISKASKMSSVSRNISRRR